MLQEEKLRSEIMGITGMPRQKRELKERLLVLRLILTPGGDLNLFNLLNLILIPVQTGLACGLETPVEPRVGLGVPLDLRRMLLVLVLDLASAASSSFLPKSRQSCFRDPALHPSFC